MPTGGWYLDGMDLSSSNRPVHSRSYQRREGTFKQHLCPGFSSTPGQDLPVIRSIYRYRSAASVAAFPVGRASTRAGAAGLVPVVVEVVGVFGSRFWRPSAQTVVTGQPNGRRLAVFGRLEGFADDRICRIVFFRTAIGHSRRLL